MAVSARICSIPLIAMAVLAHGAQPSSSLPGKWKVKSVSVPISGPEAEKAKKMMMGTTLVLSKDKTFVLTIVGPMKGKWKVEGNQVSLAVTEMMGRKMTEFLAMARTNYANDPSPRHKAALDELSKPMFGILSPDGKTITMKPPAGKSAFVFMKA